MLLKNLRINRQLQISLSLIMMFVLLLGGTAWYLTDRLWQITANLYDHPLTIRRAISEFEADILRMNAAINDIGYARDEEEILELVKTIESNESNALQQIDVIYQQYLGPRSDVDLLNQTFIEWQVIRDENVRLIREGRAQEAIQCLKSSEPCGMQVERLIVALQTVSDFALGKGNEYYQEANQQRQTMLLVLWVLLVCIVFLMVGIGITLIRNINSPLNELTRTVQEFEGGNVSARSGYISTNEFGQLSTAFNMLAADIQVRLQNHTDHQKISEMLLRQDDLNTFCLMVLQTLIEHTESQVGAVYLLNDTNREYEVLESIGLKKDHQVSFSADGHEGEFGSALVTRKIQYLRDISADSHLVFSSVSGEFLPHEIITIPIISGSEVIAMISLANLRKYTDSALQLVQDLWMVLTARFNGVMSFQKVREFSDTLKERNLELSAQARELALQADELSEQNIELEVQKKQLGEANRLKTSFLSNMSHELRTPLNSVIALSEVLRRRLKGMVQPTEYDYLEVIERNGRQLLALINDILDLSRIEAGKEELEITPVAVSEIIQMLAMMMEPLANEKGITLVNHVPADLPSLRSDAIKIRHILQNLISNAIKFTNEGRVEISASQVNGMLQIAISDTGIGIAADQLSYIFEEFRQADDSYSRQFGGTGLGLAIAKKYALLLHGRIDVKSTVGVGSTFTLSLPFNSSESRRMNAAVPVGAVVEKNEPPSPTDCMNKSILVVEDSEPALIQLNDILEQQGCQVRVARNGREALEQIAIEQPDAIILDLMMPEVDGFEVLRMIRSQEDTALLPVLILTAKHVTKDELSFLKGNHIHQLIHKGEISRENLLAAVTQMVMPEMVSTKLASSQPMVSDPVDAKKPLILVVEDYPDNQIAVQALLADTCDLLQAMDGKAGIEMASQYHPDLILLDISLPLMSGLEVLELIRADESLRHLPVVAMTSRAMTGDREEFLAHGFDAYISKPIDSILLKKTIGELLQE